MASEPSGPCIISGARKSSVLQAAQILGNPFLSPYIQAFAISSLNGLRLAAKLSSTSPSRFRMRGDDT